MVGRIYEGQVVLVKYIYDDFIVSIFQNWKMAGRRFLNYSMAATLPAFWRLGGHPRKEVEGRPGVPCDCLGRCFRGLLLRLVAYANRRTRFVIAAQAK